MALVEDFNRDRDGTDLYTLDKTLLYLGLWRGGVISGKTDAERFQALGEIDFKTPYILNGAAYDPEGQQIISVTSETHYDPENGILDDKIIFWKHSPYDNSEGAEPNEHYVIAYRGRRDPLQSPDALPVILPEQIWLNGDLKFSSAQSGAPQDPLEPKNQRLINRVLELSQRIKETLREREPVQDLARILSTAEQHNNLLADLAGKSPFLEGLSEKGGFEKSLTPFFLDVIQEENETLALNCKDAETLMAVHGFHTNTLDFGKTPRMIWEKSATHMESGMRFLVSNDYALYPKSGRHVFSLKVRPENPPPDMTLPESFELVRLEYEHDAENGLFTLADWNFMDGDKAEFQTLSRQHNLLGLYQKAMNYLNKGKYPPLHDLIHECRLDDILKELRPPPLLEDGIEMLWIPFNGRNLSKQVGTGGDGLGGGNAFLSRYKEADGTWNECGIIIDIPYQPANGNGDYEGIQPDFRAVWEKSDTVLLTHDHFDHSTIEYMAMQGLFQGKNVICTQAVEDIVRSRMSKLGVRKEDYPKFTNPEAPDSGMISMGNGVYAYSVQDKNGNIRFWNQLCLNATRHSAEVIANMITGTFNGEQWNETFFNYGDAYEFTPNGLKFAEEGQMALLRLPQISDAAKEGLIATAGLKSAYATPENKESPHQFQSHMLRDLSEKYPDRDFSKLYIAQHDPTNCATPGFAPRPDEVKRNWKACMEMVKGALLLHVPFSTSVAEINAMDELISESATLRHSTDVGANMQIRSSVMNKNGVYPDLDLRTIQIPIDKHPAVLFEAAESAVDDFLEKRLLRAEKAAAKRKDGMSAADLLEQDTPYQIMRLIKDKCDSAQASGFDKPEILYHCFMQPENLDVWRNLMQEAGRPPSTTIDFDTLQTIPKQHFAMAKKAIKGQIEADILAQYEQGALPHTTTKRGLSSVINLLANGNTAYWSLKSLEKHGKIAFDPLKRCSRNDSRMYSALMNEQPEASMHYSRTSKIAKFLRNFHDKLLIRITGPIGSAEEGFATLSRYANGDSLLDYDEFVRNTGFEISDNTPKTIFVTQTASMGASSEIAQDRLMKMLVQNRGDTVFCAFKNGFKIYNPKEKFGNVLQTAKKQGWNAQWDAKNNEIRVYDVPFHIHGHGFMDDLRRMVDHSNAKLHEIVHIPSWQNLNTARDIIKQQGGDTSRCEPHDFVSMKAVTDEKSGKLDLKITDFLTPSYWLLRLRRKYGQQYGGVVEMVRAIVQRDIGNKRVSGLDVRRSEHGQHSGLYREQTASILAQDFPQAANLDHSARNNILGPSSANIRNEEMPRSPSTGSMLSLMLRADKAQRANKAKAKTKPKAASPSSPPDNTGHNGGFSPDVI
ncbi:MAG: hypothetical protein ACK4VI_07160 [Alphaproteobacteria bacterium]